MSGRDTQIWKVITVLPNYIDYISQDRNLPFVNLNVLKFFQGSAAIPISFYYDSSSVHEFEHYLTHLQPPSISKIDYG